MIGTPFPCAGSLVSDLSSLSRTSRPVWYLVPYDLGELRARARMDISNGLPPWTHQLMSGERACNWYSTAIRKNRASSGGMRVGRLSSGNDSDTKPLQHVHYSRVRDVLPLRRCPSARNLMPLRHWPSIGARCSHRCVESTAPYLAVNSAFAFSGARHAVRRCPESHSRRCRRVLKET